MAKPPLTLTCQQCGITFQCRDRSANRRTRFCSQVCNGLSKHRPYLERMAAWLAGFSDPDQCWLWTGANNGSRGYGKIRERTRSIFAHRSAWEATHGAIPDEQLVLHRCDHPACCNPSHLFLGTQAENMHDMAMKGRSNQGERCNFTKLTADRVREIRAATGLQREIASRFAVAQQTVSRIRRRVDWRHI